MGKYITDEELEDFVPEDNKRPLTEDEQRKIDLKKLIIELKKRHQNQPIIITDTGEAKPASLLTKAEQSREIFKCGIDPIYFIETYLTVFDQMQGDGGKIVPFKLFPFQKKLIEAYQNNRENIANKYRQAGVSTTTCAFISWYIIFNENRYVALVADKLETARDELMSDIIEFIEGCPNYLRPKIATIGGKDAMGHKKYSNGSQIKAFAATKLRGPTPTLVFWDETAWTEKGDKFWESAGPAVRNTGGSVIFVSTPNGLDPIFYKTFEASRVKKSKGEKPLVNPIELWWYNDPRYTRSKATGLLDLKWTKFLGKEGEEIISDLNFSHDKRAELTKQGYTPTSTWFEEAKEGYNGDLRRMAQELLCSFLGSGDLFIPEEHIQRIEQKELKQPKELEWPDKSLYIYEDPVVNAQYLMSLDAASGYADDYSTMIIMKLSDVYQPREYTEDGVRKSKMVNRRICEMVAEYQGKISPQHLAEMAYYYGERYNKAHAVVDVSGGYGVATIESLIGFGYKNIHYSEINHKPTRDMFNMYLKTKTKVVGNGVMTVDMIPGLYISTSNRPLILQEMQRCIRMEDVIIRSPRITGEFKTFVINKKGKPEHTRTTHDDLIMALAGGLYVACVEMVRNVISPEKVKAMLDSIMIVGMNDPMIAPNDENREQKIREHEERIKSQQEQRHPQAEDYTATRTNPYGGHSWMFKGLDKNRR